MKKVLMVMLCISMWSVPAFAGCLSTIQASTPSSDFTDHGDGTVTHTKTGLMWKQCAEGLGGIGCATGAASTYTWQAALQRAETLNAGAGFAGFNDWRLPNIKELSSIVEEQCFAPAINATLFPNTPSSRYWSPSPYAAYSTFAWVVGFYYGYDSANGKSINYYVRLVRSGQ